MKINNTYKGMICIILSAFCFAVMNACVKLSGDLPTFQKAFFRNAIALLIASSVLIVEKKSFIPKKENLFDLVLRALFGTIGLVCNFYAIDRLVLADASILNKMSPFFAIVFSLIILKEKLVFKQMLIVIGAFIGALFVIKPSFANAELFPSIIGLIGGMGAGCAYSVVRKLGMKGEDKSYIVFFFSAFSTVAILPIFIANYQPMTFKQFLILIGAGVAAAGGQYFITFAYYFAPARDISVYDYSQIIFATLLGFILFGQIPDFLSIIGYIIIVLMAVLMFLYQKIKFKKDNQIKNLK